MSEPPYGTPPTMPGLGQTAGYAVFGEKPRTGMAVTALVLGIVGLTVCMPLGIVGLILGIIATVRAGREPQRYGGKGMAIAGICTGSASILWMFIAIPMLIAILLPSLSMA